MTGRIALFVGFLVLASMTAHAEDRQTPETRLYSTADCPATGPSAFAPPAAALGAMAPVAAALVSAVVSPLIDSVVDKGVEVLKAAAEAKDFPIAAPPPLVASFYQMGSSGALMLSPTIGCLVLVRAEFETGGFNSLQASRSDPLLQRIDKRFVFNPSAGAGGMQTIRIRPGTLRFYMEIALVPAEGGKAFAFRPQALVVREFESPDGLFGPTSRNYKFVIGFADPYGSDVFASAELAFANVTRDYTVDACVDVAADTYCPAAELGGIRGWFQTRPLSEDVQAMVKVRQAEALSLRRAATAAVPLGKRPDVPEDDTTVGKKLSDYCTALKAANASRAAAQQSTDERCPDGLKVARLNYEFLAQHRQDEIDRLAAVDFWNDRCKAPGGAVMALQVVNVKECLLLLHPRRVDTGLFVANVSIVENRPGNSAAKFLLPAAEKAAPVLKQALKEKLDPAEKAKADAAAATKASEGAAALRTDWRAIAIADDKVSSAQLEYDIKFKAWSVVPDDLSKNKEAVEAHVELLKAQAAANDAYRKIGLPVPFSLVG